MKRIIYLAIHRRGLMFVLFLFLAIVGYYSWTRLAIDAYPDIADTTVQVVTQVPGLAAEEIEQQISIPIERAMNGLPGLNVMRSKNTFGLLVVFDLFVSFFEPLSLDVFELLEPLPVLELFSFLSVVKTVCTSSKLIF